MNIANVKKVLPILMRNNITPFFWGSQGVGKTSLLKEYCKDRGIGLRTLYTATQEVGDLIGLLVKDDKTGTAYHTRPKWFPTIEDETEGIIFLDELNRAPNDVLQALFSFILSGTLHTHQLPPGWKVVAAGNYNSERFTVTDTSDAAWLSRFCHIDFQPTVEEWLVYAENRNMDDVAAFIRENPNMLELSKDKAGKLDTSFIVPDRRAWTEGIGKLELDQEFEGQVKEATVYELYSGLVGVTPATSYLSWLNKREKALTLKDVLTKYNGKTRDRVVELSSGKSNERRFDLLNQPIDELMTKLEMDPKLLEKGNSLENLKAFLMDIPKELSTKAFVRMAKLPSFTGKNALINDPAYCKNFAV